MKHFSTALLALLFFSACNTDIDEFKFTGKVVGGEFCSASQIGYVIDIFSPDSIGMEYTNANGTFQHAVMAYRSSRLLHMGDTIYGVAYFTKSYSSLNCNGIINDGLPEMILLSVDENNE